MRFKAGGQSVIRKGKGKKLAIIASYGGGIKAWKKAGYFNRTRRYYKKFAEEFSQIFYITYDRESTEVGRQAKVLTNPGLPNFLYSLFLPFIHARYLCNVDIITTTQLFGAWPSILAKFLFGHPLVIRTEYEWSRFEKKASNWFKFVLAKIFEIFAYNYADKTIVTSQQHRERAASWASKDKILCIPSGVDVNLFKPLSKPVNPKSLIYVGRLTPQKNVSSLIKAIADLDVKLTLIGEGELKGELISLSENIGSDTEFLGRITNQKIPEVLNCHEIFILPSLYECRPKVLLEAMACGLPVIASDIEGNRDLVVDGKNSLLCGTSPPEIRKKILQLLGNKKLQKELGKNARKTVIEKGYSLKSQINAQVEVMKSLTN